MNSDARDHFHSSSYLIKNCDFVCFFLFFWKKEIECTLRCTMKTGVEKVAAAIPEDSLQRSVVSMKEGDATYVYLHVIN